MLVATKTVVSSFPQQQQWSWMSYVPHTWQKLQLKPASLVLLTGISCIMSCPCFGTSYHPQAVKSSGVPAPICLSAGKTFMGQWEQTCSWDIWAHGLSVGRVGPCHGAYTPNGHQPGLLLRPSPGQHLIGHPHSWQGSQQSCVRSLVPSSPLGAMDAVQGVVFDCPVCAPWTHV